MYDVTFKKDGSVIRHKWVYDNEKGKGQYVDIDISDSLFDNLHRSCEIEYGFTLDHLCSLVYDEVDIYNVMFPNCWIKDFIDHWQMIHSKNYQSPKYEYNPDEIEYLELYHHWDIYNDYVNTIEYPSLHGLGWELKEDKWESYDKERPAWKAGSRIPWGVSFTDLSDMLHFPIVINEEFKIYKEIKKYDPNEDQIAFRSKKVMTIRDVIGGIFWELSFYGSPADMTIEKEKMDNIMDDLDLENNSVDDLIKSGKLVTMSSLEEELNDGYINDGFYKERT